jgi:hypothetical protein
MIASRCIAKKGLRGLKGPSSHSYAVGYIVPPLRR